MDATAELLDPEETLPDLAAPWAREVFALAEQQVLTRAIELYPQLVRTQWLFTLLVFRVWAEHLYAPHFESLTAWGIAHGMASGEVSKHRQAGELVMRQIPAENRDRVLEVSRPLVLIESGLHRLMKTDPTEAIRLATTEGLTTRALREAVKAHEPDQHHESGELRNLHFTAVTKEARTQFIRAFNRAKFLCQTANPTDSEILTLMAAECLNGMQIQPETAGRVGEAVLSWRQPDGPDENASIEQLIEAGEAAIDAGKVRCAACGCTAGARLEGLRSVPTDASSPLVWLCRDDHAAVKEDPEAGGWRGHVRRWMARPDMLWFREAFTAWLGNRTLDGL